MEMTATPLVRLRFTRAYQGYRMGHVVDLPKGIARSLTIAGIAVEVAPEPQIEFAVAPEPEAKVAITPAAKAARRRKKK
jgi:hypothetical protein